MIDHLVADRPQHQSIFSRMKDAEALSFAEALNQFRTQLGDEYVLSDQENRDKWGRTTLPEGTLPRVIVRPASTSEVQQVVQIANRSKLKLYPISTGKNWGYGDACAMGHGQVILDLGRMNQIVELNRELAYATIEPGVTQGQLASHLKKVAPELWMDATGAGPETSIIGNTVERGFGHTPHGDRFAHACSLEVVLPDGRLLKTGFGHYKGAKAANVYKWGVGPYLDGLFTQSNLGIVTRMTFWLMPAPEHFEAFFVSLKKESALGGLIDAIRPLRLRGTLRSPIHIGNDLRMISLSQGYPWEEMKGQVPLSADMRAELRKRHGLMAWFGAGGMYGSRREVAAAKKEVKKALRNVPDLAFLHFFDDSKLKHATRLISVANRVGLAPKLGRLMPKLGMMYGLLKGNSPPTCLQGGLWRARNQVEKISASTDPRDFGSGFIWIAPVVPMTRQDLERVNKLAEALLNQYGFDYQVTFSMVTPRALCAVMTIAFDKKDEEASRRATQCNEHLLNELWDAGYPPYRMSLAGMKQLDRNSEVFYDVMYSIKDKLDPEGVLSPGRYEPRRA